MRRVTGIFLLLSFITALGLLACSGTASVAPTAVPSWTVSRTPVSPPAKTVRPSPATGTPSPGKVGWVAASNANLRSGPGTGFAVVGSVKQGQALQVVERNAAGDWLRLANGAWIAAPMALPKALPAAVPNSTPKPWPNYTRFPPGSTVSVEVVTVGPAVVDSAIPEVRQVTVVVERVEVGPACECSGDLYNCGDFGWASSAQKCYDRCKQQTGEDVHGLDPDNDGLACEPDEW